MMIVDDDDKSKKEILKDSLLFFHISSLLRFPLVYERSLVSSLNIDVDDVDDDDVFTNNKSHKYVNRLTFLNGVFVIEEASPPVSSLVCSWHCVSSPFDYAWKRLDTLRTLKILKNL